MPKCLKYFQFLLVSNHLPVMFVLARIDIPVMHWSRVLQHLSQSLRNIMSLQDNS
jgi:hypothetical protein